MRAVYHNFAHRDLQTAAVIGVDLDVELGDFVAIMGPSGRGLSSLLCLLGLLDRISRGTYHLAGKDVSGLSRRAMVISPHLILADETTGKLDSEQSRVVMETGRHWHALGTTIVMATHAREDAAYANQIVEMFDGKMLLSEKNFLSQRKSSNTASWPPKHS